MHIAYRITKSDGTHEVRHDFEKAYSDFLEDDEAVDFVSFMEEDEKPLDKEEPKI